MRLHVKVVPRASRSLLAGWMGTVLKVRVAAPPERGAANAALIRTLAAALGRSPAQIRLIAGHGGERKIVEIDGLTPAELRSRASVRMQRRDP